MKAEVVFQWLDPPYLVRSFSTTVHSRRQLTLMAANLRAARLKVTTEEMILTSLRLTVADLSRVRFLDTLGVDFEARLAELRLPETRIDEFTEWRRRVRRRLRRIAPPGARPRDPKNFRALALDPFWERIRSHLAQECEMLGRTVVSGGVEEVLNCLHPTISWNAPILEVEGHDGQELELAGEGVVLAPSLFARGPFFLPAGSGWRGLPTLVYNVSLDAETTTLLWQLQEDPAAALRDLLGHTRASVLECVSTPGSTGEISRRLHISNPSASKHVTVLRRSGLVRTERKSNLAVHRLTHLGEAVLRS